MMIWQISVLNIHRDVYGKINGLLVSAPNGDTHFMSVEDFFLYKSNRRKYKYVNVVFANLEPAPINIKIVKKWNIKEPKETGDSVFFSVDNCHMSVSKSDFIRIME